LTSLIGQQLGRYEIQEEIGRGGMARVYRAHDTLLHRTVALKVLAPQLALDTEYIRRFKREAIIAASLRHPNIVTIFDVSENEGLHYIAMEYIRGRTLHAIINERGALGLSYAVAIIAQVAAALDYAHSRDAVHRDIKPHNIMIDADGGVLLTDFGIAQAPETRGEGERLTRTGIFMGTPEYISPEQASAQRVDGRSDLYSLGITAYEVITGTVPFSGATPQLMIAHLQTPPPSLATFDPSQPPELDIVLARALAKNPERRFATGAAFVAALRIVAQKYDMLPVTPEQLSELALPREPQVASAATAGAPDPTQRSSLALPPAARPQVRPAVPGADRSGSAPAAVAVPADQPTAWQRSEGVQRAPSARVAPEPRFDRRWVALISVALALLAVAVVASRGLSGRNEPGRPTRAPTAQPSVVATAAPTIAPAVPTLAPSSTPSPTLAPTITPTNTLEPSPAPLPPTRRPPAPTDLPVLPTDIPPTETPVPPTETPVPPTETPVPPTETPVPYPPPGTPSLTPPTATLSGPTVEPSPTITATASLSQTPGATSGTTTAAPTATTPSASAVPTSDEPTLTPVPTPATPTTPVALPPTATMTPIISITPITPGTPLPTSTATATSATLTPSPTP
jgi:serine/threonine-protein kinase